MERETPGNFLEEKKNRKASLQRHEFELQQHTKTEGFLRNLSNQFRVLWTTCIDMQFSKVIQAMTCDTALSGDISDIRNASEANSCLKYSSVSNLISLVRRFDNIACEVLDGKTSLNELEDAMNAVPCRQTRESDAFRLSSVNYVLGSF